MMTLRTMQTRWWVLRTLSIAFFVMLSNRPPFCPRGCAILGRRRRSPHERLPEGGSELPGSPGLALARPPPRGPGDGGGGDPEDPLVF